MASLKDIRNRIDSLPEPYQSRARENYRDAFDDLVVWPQHCVKILRDLEESVKAHEEDAKGAGDADKE